MKKLITLMLFTMVISGCTNESSIKPKEFSAEALAAVKTSCSEISSLYDSAQASNFAKPEVMELNAKSQELLSKFVAAGLIRDDTLAQMGLMTSQKVEPAADPLSVSAAVMIIAASSFLDPSQQDFPEAQKLGLANDYENYFLKACLPASE
jgi:PBP1b-binding outer membrane lipoprotein LpoB